MGKENTSSGHAADSNISKLREGSRLIEKNKTHSSDAVFKVSRNLLHETSETSVRHNAAGGQTDRNEKAAAILSSNWEADIRNPEWHPFRVIMVNGKEMVEISLVFQLHTSLSLIACVTNGLSCAHDLCKNLALVTICMHVSWI